MFHFKTAALAAAAAMCIMGAELAGAVAVPQDGSPGSLLTLVYCVDPNFHGKCVHGPINLTEGACTDVPPDFQGAISSIKFLAIFGLQIPLLSCALYSNAGCSGNEYYIHDSSFFRSEREVKNFAVTDPSFDNSMSSYSCYSGFSTP